MPKTSRLDQANKLFHPCSWGGTSGWMVCHMQINKVNAQLPNILQMLRDDASGGGQLELVVLVPEVPCTIWAR